jgi:hypothetical protein
VCIPDSGFRAVLQLSLVYNVIGPHNCDIPPPLVVVPRLSTLNSCFNIHTRKHSSCHSNTYGSLSSPPPSLIVNLQRPPPFCKPDLQPNILTSFAPFHCSNATLCTLREKNILRSLCVPTVSSSDTGVPNGYLGGPPTRHTTTHTVTAPANQRRATSEV